MTSLARLLHCAALLLPASSLDLERPHLSAECQGALEKVSCGRDCYPELLGVPCDRHGEGGCRRQTPSAGCDCSWSPALKSVVRACGAEPSGAAVPVFAAGDAGISCYRIPAVSRTAKGTLLAFAEARHGGCGDGQVHEIAVRRSTDEGKTWSNVSFVAGGSHHRVGNPYPISTSSGKVVLLYIKLGHGVDGKSNGMVVSEDDGVSWGPEVDVGAGFGHASGSAPGPGAGIEVQEGALKRMLVVLHHGAYVRDYVTRSDDGGVTWQAIPQTFPKMDEATMADLGEGHVLLNMRHTNEGKLGKAVARSTDGGLTWSSVSYDSALVGPVCQGSLAAFDGAVYFSNPASSRSRSNLTVRRSDDGGRTWPRRLVVQANRSAGYSSLVQGALGGGRGGILYESSTPGGIDFAAFHLDLSSSNEEEVVLIA